MPAVLIVDVAKSSIVMTSEVFKDKLPGILVTVARTGAEGLQALRAQAYDIVVIDFDLPDVDGVTLAKLVRAEFKGPILMTAYPEKIVGEALNAEMYLYDDVMEWVKKPVKFEDLASRIEKYMVQKRRFQRRFDTNFASTVTSASPRSKMPKIVGNVVNLSIGGACIKTKDKFKAKVGDAVYLSCTFEAPKVLVDKKTKPAVSAKGKKPVAKPSIAQSLPPVKPAKIKGTIVWSRPEKKSLGVQFSDLPEKTLEDLAEVLRTAAGT